MRINLTGLESKQKRPDTRRTAIGNPKAYCVTSILLFLMVISSSCSINRTPLAQKYKLVANIQLAIKDHLVMIFEGTDRNPVVVLYPVTKTLNARYTVNQVRSGGKINLNLEEIPDSLSFEPFRFPKTSRVDPNNYDDWIGEFDHRGKRYEYYDSKTGKLLGKCYYASNLFVLDYLSPLLFDVHPTGLYPTQR